MLFNVAFLSAYFFTLVVIFVIGPGPTCLKSGLPETFSVVQGYVRKMGTPLSNRFNLLNDFADTTKPARNDTTSPPSKKVKKRSPRVRSGSSEENIGGSKPSAGKSSKVNGKQVEPKNKTKVTRADSKVEIIKPNRRLVLSDSDSEVEGDKPKAPTVEAPNEPTLLERNTCPATDYYVRLARESHHIPSMAQLLDRAGAFGKMFENGNPSNCLATDIVNIDGIYGMGRPRFDERRVQWEIKASLVFFEQGLIQQVFDREKIVLFFNLIRKHRDRIPNLYRLYNSIYDLESSE